MTDSDVNLVIVFDCEIREMLSEQSWDRWNDGGRKGKKIKKNRGRGETANGKSLELQVDLQIQVVIEKEATVWLSPEGHGAAGGRLFEPGSSENSPWIKTATVLKYKHEVACSERDDIYYSNHIQHLLLTLLLNLLFDLVLLLLLLPDFNTSPSGIFVQDKRV